MDAILYKSKSNIASAERLYNVDYYASSAHAAYYGVYLLFKYILNSKGVLDYASQDEETKGANSHKIIEEKVMDYLDGMISDAVVDVQSAYDNLKRSRKKADYTGNEMTKNEAAENLGYIKEIIDILKPL